jgi:hypothetical protein
MAPTDERHGTALPATTVEWSQRPPPALPQQPANTAAPAELAAEAVPPAFYFPQPDLYGYEGSLGGATTEDYGASAAAAAAAAAAALQSLDGLLLGAAPFPMAVDGLAQPQRPSQQQLGYFDNAAALDSAASGSGGGALGPSTFTATARSYVPGVGLLPLDGVAAAAVAAAAAEAASANPPPPHSVGGVPAAPVSPTAATAGGGGGWRLPVLPFFGGFGTPSGHHGVAASRGHIVGVETAGRNYRNTIGGGGGGVGAPSLLLPLMPPPPPPSQPSVFGGGSIGAAGDGGWRQPAQQLPPNSAARLGGGGSAGGEDEDDDTIDLLLRQLDASRLGFGSGSGAGGGSAGAPFSSREGGSGDGGAAGATAAAFGGGGLF